MGDGVTSNSFLAPTQALAPSLALVEPTTTEWDAFVRAHPHGNLLQLSGWGTLKSEFGWHVRRLAVVSTDGVQAGAQLLFKRRFGVSVGYVPRGPLLADAASNAVLLDALDRLCRRNRAVFLRLEPNMLEGNAGADALHSDMLVRGFQVAEPLQPRSSVHLNLAPESDRLLAAMSKGHRADIRRATREGVVVREGASDIDLDAFYAIMQATSARAEFAIHSHAYYATAWRTFGTTGDALLLLAEWHGRPVATAMMFADSHAGLYLYSGSTEEGLKSGAQHAIQWHALQWAKARGAAFYDFWGIPDPFGQAANVANAAERDQLEEAAKSDPLFGVYRFKKGFGGQVVRYLPAYDRVYIPALYRIWQRRMQ